jgi:hypothetical protein
MDMYRAMCIYRTSTRITNRMGCIACTFAGEWVSDWKPLEVVRDYVTL